MLPWISEKLWARFFRGLFGLAVIVLVVDVIAMGPLRAAIRRQAEKKERTAARKR